MVVDSTKSTPMNVRLAKGTGLSTNWFAWATNLYCINFQFILTIKKNIDI